MTSPDAIASKHPGSRAAGTKGSGHRLTYRDGDFGSLWLIYIVNILLMFLTLGLYRFWARTRVRRFLWARVSFEGSPFEYTGTGWELFIGFVKVLFLILLPLILIFGSLRFFIAGPGDGWLEIFLSMLGSVFFFWLYMIGGFLSFRYRVNRTSWRGIRGRVEGSAIEYGTTAFLYHTLAMVTFGLTRPLADAKLTRLKYEALRIGDWQGECSISAKALYPTFLACWSITTGVLIVLTVFLGISPFEVTAPISPDAQPSWGMSVETGQVAIALNWKFFSPLLVSSVGVFWYFAKLLRETAATTRVGGIRLACDLTGAGLLWYYLGNALIVTFSFSLLLPRTWVRKAKLLTGHFWIADKVPVERLMQSAHNASSIGEEMAMDFDGL